MSRRTIEARRCSLARSRLPASVRFHYLCDSYATWLISDGVPVGVGSWLLAHEHITTTLNRYAYEVP